MSKLPVDVDDEGEWSHACVRILGETVQPEEIEAKLGLKATRTHLKGQRRSPGRADVWRESLWLLQSPLSEGYNLADHLKWILDLIEARLDVIRALAAEYRVDLICGFSSGSAQGGGGSFTLDSTTLARAGKLGVPLIVDLYPPVVDEGAEEGKWSDASLRVSGETLRTQEVEAALGVAATRTHLKDQPRSPGHDAVWRESVWSLQSPARGDHNLVAHLNWVLDRVGPGLDAIKALSAKYRVDVRCAFSSANGQGGFTLDSTTLARFGRLGVPLVVDLYPHGVDEKAKDSFV